jgi:uncharacterized protein YbaP (TraB family)
MRAALLVCLLGCSSTTSCPEIPHPPGPVHPFLWQATGPSTIYLYGTYHIASRDDVPEVAWARLAASEALVLELPEQRPATARFEDLHRLPRGQTLDRLLSADAWYDLRDALSGVVSEDNLRKMRPWIAMDLLRRTKYPNRQASMDEAILREGRRGGLAVMALEEWEEQTSLIDETLDVTELEAMIANRDRIACNLSRTMTSYRDGDLEALTGSFDELTADKLLVQRNQKWIVRLEEIGRATKTAFVAVGVAHMAGATGLPALLEQRGYRVTRL